MRQVAEQMKEKDRQDEITRSQRYFDTTQGSDYTKKDQFQNQIGRRQMKTQDCANVSINERDEQLIVEHGTWRRLQKNDDEELKHRIPKGDYHQQQPVTYWTHQNDRKNYYMSEPVGTNAFARTSGLTQPADQTKSIAGFYGNIDQPLAGTRVDFRKSEGRDLSLTNPYLEKTVEVSNFSDISKRVVEASRVHAAGLGLRGFRIFLRVIDKDGSGLVVPEDLKYAFKAYGIAITVDEMNALLKYFDQARVGRISLNDMLHAMRSSSLSAARASIAEAAYNKLDRTGNQQVTIGDLVDNYDVTPNPELVNGRKTVEELRQEF